MIIKNFQKFNEKQEHRGTSRIDNPNSDSDSSVKYGSGSSSNRPEKEQFDILSLKRKNGNTFNIGDQCKDVFNNIYTITEIYLDDNDSYKAKTKEGKELSLLSVNHMDIYKKYSETPKSLTDKSVNEHPSHNVGNITIRTSSGAESYKLSDIIRFEANQNYTYIYLVNGKKILTATTMGKYEEKLKDKNFCRVHHSHFVNLRHIKDYKKTLDGNDQRGNASDKTGLITMSDGTKIEVSKRKKKEFVSKFTHLENMKIFEKMNNKNINIDEISNIIKDSIPEALNGFNIYSSKDLIRSYRKLRNFIFGIIYKSLKEDNIKLNRDDTLLIKKQITKLLDSWEF